MKKKVISDDKEKLHNFKRCILQNYIIQSMRKQLLDGFNIRMEITEEKLNKLNSITGAR